MLTVSETPRNLTWLLILVVIWKEILYQQLDH